MNDSRSTQASAARRAARSAVEAAGPVLPVGSPAELVSRINELKRRGSVRLGQALLDLGLVDDSQLAEAQRIQQLDPSRLLGDILCDAGIADDEGIRAGLAYQLGIPAVDLRHWNFAPEVLNQLPPALIEACRVVPVHLNGNVLHVAMSNVLDRDALDAMRVGTPLIVQPAYAPAADIDWLLNRHFRSAAAEPVSDADLERHRGQYVGHASSNIQTHLAASDNVIVRLADQIIAEGCRDRASDIHIEPLPAKGDTVVRVRIDGRMHVKRTIPWMYRDALVSRFKVMANLNVADHRSPQDGKIVFRRTGSHIELRVAILPTAGGVEDVVLRILDSSTALPLEAVGLREHDHGRLRTLIEKPHGILLVCGPTGSGKTTTLHSVLRHLNDGSRKIWTAENPVEITQVGLRQLEVNPKAGLTFAAALRAFLRADPDVIMVGEIRDGETAKTALEASLTGHLVLSTLHTNSAPESVVRLLEMGMNPFNFSDALLGVLAQRLARSLCVHCRVPEEATEEMLVRLASEYLESEATATPGRDALVADWMAHYGRAGVLTLYHAKGCEECGGTGYKGRTGLFELMPASNEIKRAIISGAPAAELFALAMHQGMSTLKQDGIHKILDGTTDLAQVLAVSQR